MLSTQFSNLKLKLCSIRDKNGKEEKTNKKRHTSFSYLFEHNFCFKFET